MNKLPKKPGRRMETPSSTFFAWGKMNPLSLIRALMIPPTAPAPHTVKRIVQISINHRAPGRIRQIGSSANYHSTRWMNGGQERSERRYQDDPLCATARFDGESAQSTCTLSAGRNRHDSLAHSSQPKGR